MDSKETRIIISEDDYNKLLSIVRSRNKSLAKRIEKGHQDYLERTAPKREATKRATQVRVNKAKEKIKKAIETLKRKDKEITRYAIHKEARADYATLKRYEDYINELIKL
jgi:hypothetical protein